MTENQKVFVGTNYSNMSNEEIAIACNASVGEVKAYAKYHKLKKSKKYLSSMRAENAAQKTDGVVLSEDQKKYILTHYKDMSNADIAKVCGTTSEKVKNFGTNSGLKKSPERLKAAQKEVRSKQKPKYEFSHLSSIDKKAYSREAMKTWRAKNRDHFNAICKKSRDKNREAVKARNKAYKDGQRAQVIAHYSNNTNKCVCCGYDNYSALVLDHIHGGGRKHTSTKGVGMGSSLVCWIIKNNYPPYFQVLCHNCNFLKGTSGVCSCKN